MIEFIREIFPVGQGGFVFERIGDYSIVFDCGSITSPTRVSMYIGVLRSRVTVVDNLYISHFDRDHVNCITDLLNAVKVRKAIIPYVPKEYRDVYDVLSSGAYGSMIKTLTYHQTEIQELEETEITTKKDIWEWISQPMLKKTDWPLLKSEFVKQRIDATKLSDPVYINVLRDTIRDCFKEAFKKKGGTNANGLIMLSQRVGGNLLSNKLTQGKTVYSLTDKTAALYLGDAHVKGKDVSVVKSFLSTHYRGDLLLVQIPHHGSESNSGRHFDVDIPARYYYYQDSSSKRLQKNSYLYASLISSSPRNLLDVRDLDSDLISHVVQIN